MRLWRPLQTRSMKPMIRRSGREFADLAQSERPEGVRRLKMRSALQLARMCKLFTTLRRWTQFERLRNDRIVRCRGCFHMYAERAEKRESFCHYLPHSDSRIIFA